MSFTQVQRRNGTPSQRQFFDFLHIKEEKGKIGTIIKQLNNIRKTVGGGVFINYKRESDAENISEWLAENPQLIPVRSHGSGFYIWAYKKSSIECAKIYLHQEESKWIERQYNFRENKDTMVKKQKDNTNLFEVLCEKEEPKGMVVEDHKEKDFPVLSSEPVSKGKIELGMFIEETVLAQLQPIDWWADE